MTITSGKKCKGRKFYFGSVSETLVPSHLATVRASEQWGQIAVGFFQVMAVRKQEEVWGHEDRSNL